MRDDRLLEAMARVAREKRQSEMSELELDERWDRLATGALSAAEEAELRALAERSEVAREAYEAFRPLDTAFHQQVLGAVRTQRAAERERRAPVPAPPRLRGWWEWLGGAVAAGATALLLVFSQAPSMPSALPVLARVAALAGETLSRGEDQAAVQEHRYTAGSLLPVRGDFEKEVPASGRFDVRAYLLRQGDLVSTAQQQVAWAPHSVRVTGKVGKEVRPGLWRPILVIAAAGELPSDEVVRSKLVASPSQKAWQGKGWRARRSEDTVEIVPPRR